MNLNIAKTVVLATTIAVAGSAAAFVEGSYVGFGVANSWMGAQEGMKSVVAKSYPQANIFAGMRFDDMFAVELGYTLSKRKSKSSTFKAKDFTEQYTTVFGAATDKDDEVSITSKSKVQGYNLDFIGFMPMNDCVDLFGIVGFGWKRGEVELYTTEIDKKTATAAQRKVLDSVKGKNKMTLRLGIGASYMFTDTAGVRTQALFETTGRVRVKGDENYSKAFGNKFFKDSYTFGVDVFYKF